MKGLAEENRVLIIAEIGQNHSGDMELAKRLVLMAKESGADIAKLQFYDADKILSPSSKWYQEAKKAQISKEQATKICQWCRKADIEFMASVFDIQRFRWCEELGVTRYKIASRSIYDQELINAIASSGKDMIVSLGMYEGNEFPRIKTSGRVDFLYCVSKYPATPEELNISEVDFSEYSGFSDHTIGIEAALIAVARGAKIIEKHFTLDKRMHGPDHVCSMEPEELQQLVWLARKFETVLYSA